MLNYVFHKHFIDKYKFSTCMCHPFHIIRASAPNLHMLGFSSALILFLSILYQSHMIPSYSPNSCGQNRKWASLMWGSEVEHMKLKGTSLLMAGYRQSHVYGKPLGQSSLFFYWKMRVQSFSHYTSANDLLDLIRKHKSKWNVARHWMNLMWSFLKFSQKGFLFSTLVKWWRLFWQSWCYENSMTVYGW